MFRTFLEQTLLICFYSRNLCENAQKKLHLISIMIINLLFIDAIT
jgi:hypothetical protein